jgi:hypothetical protein
VGEKEVEMKSTVLLTAALAYPIYPNRKAYRDGTGEEAPPWDASRKIKKWRDPEAGADGLPEVIYTNNIMVKADGIWALKNGLPVVRPLVLSVEEAKTVNLPPEDPSGNTSIQPGTGEVGCPFRDLLPDEVIMVAGAEMGFLSGKVLVIRNMKLYAEEQAVEADESGKFTATDRAMLSAIAEKVLGG